MKIAVIYTTFLIALLGFAAFSLADRGSKTGPGPQRDVSTDISGDGRSITINSDSPNTDPKIGGKSRFRFEIKLDGFPRFRVRYQTFGQNATQFTFRVGMRRLIEFNDTNNQGFDPTDPILSQFSLIGQKNQWGAFNSSTSTDSANVTVKKFCATRTILAASFTFCVRVSDGSSSNAGYAMDPNRIKLDIAFKNYPYVANNTKLALIAFVQSQSSSSKNSDDKRIAIGGDGSFTWVSNFNNTNKTFPILPSPFFSLSNVTQGEGAVNDDDDNNGGESSNAIAFTFNTNDRLTDVLWDPEVGLTDSSAFGLIINPLLLIVCAVLYAFTVL